MMFFAQVSDEQVKQPVAIDVAKGDAHVARRLAQGVHGDSL